MEDIEKVLEKLKEARKDRGYSHENMANELRISQGAYTNLEKNESKLTVERLIKISEILEKPIYYFFEANPNNIYYNQPMAENSIGMQQIENLYQDNKETTTKLSETYEATIQCLKDEIAFLREMIQRKS